MMVSIEEINKNIRKQNDDDDDDNDDDDNDGEI